MTWRKVSNSNSVKPEQVEKTKSSVYVRRNFVLVPESGEGDRVIPEHWEYEEQVIPAEDWELYQTALTNTSDISDIQTALVELAEIIMEG